MGQGSKFASNIATRGGYKMFVTGSEVKSQNDLAEELLEEMKQENIKYTKNKILFIAKLENGRKVFMESKALKHVIEEHADDFKNAFNVEENEIGTFLCDTILKGELVESSVHINKNGIEGYRNIYYYKGFHCVASGIASNGYVVTAFPIECPRKEK